MPTISSLLRSAESARAKQRNYEDSVIEFNWQNSAKTPDDWTEYQGFLSNRQSTAPSGSEQLSYAKKLKSAEDTYVSAEIEREGIKILEGTGSLTDKLTKVSSLYERAVERGNYDLAQNLYKQGLGIQEQIMNEQERAQRVAGSMALNGVKDLKSLVKQLESGTGADGTGIIQINDNEAYKSLYAIGQELKGAGDTGAGLFTDAYLTTQAIRSLVEDAYATATSQDAVDYIENNLRPVLDGTKKYKLGNASLTASEIDLGYRSALANNPVYSVTTGVDAEGNSTFSLKKNKVEDFAWIRNDDGTYEAMQVQTRQTNESMSTRIDDKGNVITGDQTNDTQSVQNRLAQLGFLVETGQDGKITLTDRDGRIYTDAALEGTTVRFRGDPNEYSQGTSGVYEINILDQPSFGALGQLNAGTVRAVAPDETSDFGINSEFGGRLSSATDAGRAATLSMAGVSPYSRPQFNMDQVVESLVVKNVNAPRITSIDNEGYVFGVPGTSSLLQSAGMTRTVLDQKNRQEEQARLNSQALSLPNVPNINQTPVRQIASSGAPVRQLKVNTAPTTQRISGVTSAPTTRKIAGVSKTSGGQGGFGNFSGTLQVK